MASLIEQLQERTEDADETARILEVQDEDTDAILDALAPDTRREIYQSLFAEPRTTSELAKAIDTSLQNVQYHLEPLEDAGLIEEIDTVYSEKGAEMAVYAPAADPLVFVGDKQTLPDVKQSLRPVVSGLAILGAVSLFVQWLAHELITVAPEQSSGPSMMTAQETVRETAATESPGTLTWLVMEVLEPGLVVFVAGLVIAALAVWIMSRTVNEGNPPWLPQEWNGHEVLNPSSRIARYDRNTRHGRYDDSDVDAGW
ncbi:MAG: putative transcriptional regulator [Halonotius sp. J07HN6]|nr:MAG: putative transcriptional regulator [Halonotius sp. J07HN6]